MNKLMNKEIRQSFYKGKDRVVVKVGSSLLVEDGKLSKDKIEKICKQIILLKEKVKDVVVITSGAVGAGYSLLLNNRMPNTIPLKQASASIGQVLVMKYYTELLGRADFLVSQILLTDAVLKDRERYVNARNTLNTLLKYNVIPIVNENDTVSVDEIKFGDNDSLAALVTSLIDADLLIILSDVEGFYKDFELEAKRKLLHVIPKITKEIEFYAKKESSKISKGGMITKIKAAKVTTEQGIAVLVANGRKEDIIERIYGGEVEGSLFLPSKGFVPKNKKRWIHLNARAKGKVRVDANAYKAVGKDNKSLLAKGILSTEGDYEAYDIIELIDVQDKVFAKGIIYYSKLEIEKIKGLHSKEIEGVLGYCHYNVVVHKDNLALID